MYDDKLDGLVDDETYQQKFTEAKTRQQEILIKMQRHVKADESFHITVTTVLNLASRARALFESSEVDEKRQLLNFVVQNLILEGEKLIYTLREPFSMIMKVRECPSGWGFPHLDFEADLKDRDERNTNSMGEERSFKDAQKTNGGSWTKNQRSRKTRDLQSAEIQQFSIAHNV